MAGHKQHHMLWYSNTNAAPLIYITHTHTVASTNQCGQILRENGSEFRVITVQFLDAGICWTACRPIFITLSSSFKFAVSSNFFFCPLLIHFFSDSNLFCTFCSSSSQDTCHSGSPSSALSSKPLRATSSKWCITWLEFIRVLWKKNEQTFCPL